MLQGKAYATPKASPASLSLDLLKQDLVQSLKVGLQLTLEDLESSGMFLLMNLLGNEWTPTALSSTKLKNKSEFRIRLPQRIFYKFSTEEPLEYSEYQMAYEEDTDIYQRIQEMFLDAPILANGAKIMETKKKIKKTKATIKKAMIEETQKPNSKGMQGVVIVGIALLVLVIYAYLYLRR